MTTWRTLILLAMAGVAPASARAQTREMVSIGSHRLDVLRMGTGAPAIILEAGLGDSLDDWAPLVPAIAEYATVVAYSRSGLGRSEPGSSHHGAPSEMRELHELLGRLGIHPPFVLVGRSYGGMLARLYTSLYPADVAGLVLVDGVHEEQVRRWGALDGTYPGAFRAFFDSVARTPRRAAEVAEIRETMRIQAAGAVEGMRPLPDIPIAVLTSMRSDSTAKFVNLTPRGHEAWRQMHDEWFRRSTNGIHIVTSRSGHAIQEGEPELVIEAIRFVLDRVRAR